jgi:hypothetical protein
MLKLLLAIDVIVNHRSDLGHLVELTEQDKALTVKPH